MVDYKCRKYQKQVNSFIEIFNSTDSKYKLRIAETSDDLDSLPTSEANKRVEKYLNLIDENLGKFYNLYNGIINEIDETTLKNDTKGEFRWQEFKLHEMISTTGLFYIDVLQDNEFLGFFSFNVADYSLLKDVDKNIPKKRKLTFFDKPKNGNKKRNIFYLMEIQLASKASRKGLGKAIFEDFIFNICREENFDIEFVCFCENTQGNGFYKKIGIPMVEDFKLTYVSEEMSEVINIYRMGNENIPSEKTK